MFLMAISVVAALKAVVETPVGSYKVREPTGPVCNVVAKIVASLIVIVLALSHII